MGARGPRKKLPLIEALEGNPTKKVIEDSGIEALGSPFVAEHLSDDARGCIEVIKQSMPDKVYSALDSFLLAAFGTAWAIHKIAAHTIASPDFEYIVMSSKESEMASPWLTILNKQAQLMASLGDRLGLDPKSRAALKLPNARQQKSRFDELIERRPSSNSSSSLQFPAGRDRAENSN
jgi:phage terminase small subunit